MSPDTALDFEQCEKNLENLTHYYSKHVGTRNEATTRSHLIDTLIYQCLGWAKHDAIEEEAQGKDFTDYSFFTSRKIMILEAKREGEWFDIPAGKTELVYSIKSLCRGNANLSAAIRQVARYCQDRGVPIGVFSNGHQLIAFIASRDDATPPLEGKCVAFSSLALMYKNFLQLWNLLSRHGIDEKNLHRKLLAETRPTPPPTLALGIPGYPGTKNRNIFQTDLQLITEAVIEDIPQSPLMREQFLRFCYCTGGALSQHSLANRILLTNRYASIFPEGVPQPLTQPASVKNRLSPDFLGSTLSRRPVLLLGDVGAGKTIFLQNLINVEARDVIADAIPLYIDLGSKGNLAVDLKDFVLNELTDTLRAATGIDIYEDGFVRNVYRSKLQDFRKSIHAPLEKINPTLFLEREIELLAGLISNKADHLKQSFNSIATHRKKQIVVFLDNSDQRDDSLQDAAFLIAVELAEHWPVLVYLPLRPETFHRSIRSGALSGYHPKAFTISPPRTDRVIDLRLQFALKLTETDLSEMSLPGTPTVSLQDVKVILRSFLSSMDRNYDLVECIDNISGGNIRQALSLVKGFFGSGHVDTKRIAQQSDPRHPWIIPLHQFVRAAIFGDYVHYEPTRSPVANLFDIYGLDSREHFILPAALGLLKGGMSQRETAGFVEADRIYREFQAFGFTPDQIDYALSRASRKKLVDSSARQSIDGKEQPRSFRITTIGLYHVDKLVTMFTYVDSMTVTTPILDQVAHNTILDVDGILDRVARTRIFCAYLDEQWTRCSAMSHLFDWTVVSSAIEADIAAVMTKASA